LSGSRPVDGGFEISDADPAAHGKSTAKPNQKGD
jgi:hypothetical protein